jgi:hypothetical protein
MGRGWGGGGRRRARSGVCARYIRKCFELRSPTPASSRRTSSGCATSAPRTPPSGPSAGRKHRWWPRCATTRLAGRNLCVRWTITSNGAPTRPRWRHGPTTSNPRRPTEAGPSRARPRCRVAAGRRTPTTHPKVCTRCGLKSGAASYVPVTCARVPPPPRCVKRWGGGDGVGTRPQLPQSDRLRAEARTPRLPSWSPGFQSGVLYVSARSRPASTSMRSA